MQLHMLQEDNMLQAMRMFFDGAVPNGRVIPDNAPHLAQSPMAIAPLHTMNNGGSLMPDSHMKSVTASLQSLQVFCPREPVKMHAHIETSTAQGMCALMPALIIYRHDNICLLSLKHR